jgi:hypothetical protein
MGLIFRARCERCAFERSDLKLGATRAQMSADRRSSVRLFACAACRDVAQVELFLGEPPGSPPCDRCQAPLSLEPARELRVAGLKGDRLAGHACPRCGEKALAFTETGRFL